MQKRYVKFLACFAAALMFLSSFSFVALAITTQYRTEVTNKIASGDINIDIHEYELDANGEEIEYINNKTVMPGQIVSKIVRVENIAESAWIRMKAEYYLTGGLEWLSDCNIVLADETIPGNEGHWIKHGEYFYYTAPVPTEGVITFMTQLIVPTYLDNSAEKRGFSIKLTAEAVQSEYFEVGDLEDTSVEDPWNDLPIEVCEHDAPYAYGTEGDTKFTVEFSKEASDLIHNPEDFFQNWGNIMPGETVSDELTVSNTFEAATIYFYTENVAEDEDQLKLLNQLELEIIKVDKDGNETVIYSGILSGTVTPVSLGNYDVGESATLKFSVKMPERLQNEYSLLNTQTKWVFITELPVVLPRTGMLEKGVIGYAVASAALFAAGTAILVIMKRKVELKNEP